MVEPLLAPSLAAAIAWESLVLLPGSFVDEELARSESDLLFEARAADGARVRVYVLFEHQSTVDAAMPFRVLRYMVRIWEREAGALVPIVPVVLHHSETGWTAARRLSEPIELGTLAGTGLEAHLPDFAMIVDDVSFASDESIAGRTSSAVVRLVLATLREARRASDGASLITKLGRLVRDVVRSESGEPAYLRVVRYILSVSVDGDPRPFFEALGREVGPERKESAMGLLETLVERGRNEGRREAQRETLTALLVARFGPIAAPARARVLAMDDAELARAQVAVLSAATVDDALR